MGLGVTDGAPEWVMHFVGAAWCSCCFGGVLLTGEALPVGVGVGTGAEVDIDGQDGSAALHPSS